MYPEEEAARVLETVMVHLRGGLTSGTCRDINGNTVGKWEIEQ
jgi:hypothetical protein